MILKRIYLLIFITLLLSFKSTKRVVSFNDDYKLIAHKTDFIAGENITLKFSTSGSLQPSLYLSYSYGNTILKPKFQSGVLKYHIPNTITNKAGIINWTLLAEQKPLSGQCVIHPQPKAKRMETYLGPPSIAAGDIDYAMVVVIPTDSLDNPLQDNTDVNLKYQFLNKEQNSPITIKNGITYKYIYSEYKTGRILLSSECTETNSKEFTLNVLPNIPANFNISYDRNHPYADGNQVTTFSTSVIKDQYENVVSDGTFVAFFIKNEQNTILKMAGTTINGVAEAKIIHPDHQANWQVQAFIEGMAKSNRIKLSYKAAISDFQIHFSEDHRTVTVGPLQSFMNQMIPDGLQVSLSVYKNKTKVNTLIKSSFEGYVTFKLDVTNFPSNHYSFKVETAGIKKTINPKKL